MLNSGDFGGSGGFDGFEKYERKAYTASGKPKLSRNGNCEVFRFGQSIDDDEAVTDGEAGAKSQAELVRPAEREGQAEPTGETSSGSMPRLNGENASKSELIKRRSYMPNAYASTDSDTLLSAAQVGGGVIGRTFASFFIRRGIIFLALGAIWLVKVALVLFCSPTYEAAERTGTAYYASKMYPEAIAEYQRGLASSHVPKLDQALLNADIARCYNGMDTPEMALKLADVALRAVPPYDDVDTDKELSDKLQVQAYCHSIKKDAYDRMEKKSESGEEWSQYSLAVQRMRHLAAHPRKN